MPALRKKALWMPFSKLECSGRYLCLLKEGIPIVYFFDVAKIQMLMSPHKDK